MSKRMVIERYCPPPIVERDPGLPPLPELPPPDGTMSGMFIGKRVRVGAYSGETLIAFARAYARLALDAAKATEQQR